MAGTPKEKEHYRKERIYWLTGLGMTFVIALGAGFSARYAYRAAQEAHDQVEASQSANRMNAEIGRAWIGFTFARLTGPADPNKSSYQPIAVGEAVFLHVTYENFGREPATNAALTVWANTYTAKAWLDGAANKDAIRQNASCRNDAKLLGESIVFPSDQTNSVVAIFDFSQPAFQARPISISPEIISGGGGVVFMLCFVYRTSGQVRHTAYGFYYQGKTISPTQLGSVVSGNDAD